MLDRLWLTVLACTELWALWSGQSLPTLAATLALLVSGSLIISTKWSLRAVSYRRHLAEHRAMQGDEVELKVEVRNLKPLPLTWLQVEDGVPRSLDVVGGNVLYGTSGVYPYLAMVFAMLPYERVVRRLRVACRRRGDHVFGPARLESGDYLGLLRSYASAPLIDKILVLPKVFPLAIGRVASNALVGRDPVRRLLLTDPLRVVGARQYSPSDPFRSIDWRASARVGSLMTRLEEPSTTPSLDLVLDFGRPQVIQNELEHDGLELAISLAASIAAHAAERRWAVGLRANGHSGMSPILIAPSLAPSGLGEILETLARASTHASERMAGYLTKASSFGATSGISTIVITTALGEDLLAALLDMRARGRSISVIHVASANVPRPNVDGLLVWRAVYDKQWASREALVLGE